MKFKRIILLLSLYLIVLQIQAQWQLVMQEGGNIYSLVEQNDVMFAGTQFGIFKSDDGGVTWVEANNGLTNTVVHPMLVNGTRLFAGTEAGVFISDDGGDNWTESNQGLIISKINSFLLTDDGIYTGTDDQGIFYSTDNGENWIAKNNGLSNMSVKTMVSHIGRLFAGTDGAGVFYSDNLGENWIQSNNGLTSWFISHLTSKDDKLFVSTNYKFYISETNGLSWNALNTPFDYEVLCSVNYSDYMFVGTNGDGVAYTTDYGQTWTLWNEGLTNKNMYCIEIFDNYVWSACCCGYGLYKRLLPKVIGLEQKNDDYNLTVYPNPANQFLNIKFDTKIDKIRIVNMFGSTIRIVNTDASPLYKLDVQALTAGIYILEMQTKKGVLIEKVLVRH